MKLSKRPIYFNAKLHKYTNDIGEPFISSTTLVSKYERKFSEDELKIAKACEKIGRNPNYHDNRKYLKYKNKSYRQILKEWKDKGDKGRNIGNTKHNYLENSVKSSSGFYNVFKSRYNEDDTVRLYTIEDILIDHTYGELNLDYFIKAGVKDKYPKIYNIIASFIKDGWKIYSEIATFDFESMISGLVDILFVRDNRFVILDWKTMNAPIRFDGGYWDKDKDGNCIQYINTDKRFKKPLTNLQHSTGNKIALQLSLYAKMIEGFGLELVGIIICHITHDLYIDSDKDVIKHSDWLGKNRIELIPITYLKNDINNMIGHYNYNKNKGQLSI